MAKGLTAKQQRFVDEYLVDLNAKQAAIRAGYSPGAAKEQGSRLLTYDNVAEAVANGMEKRASRTEITQDMVLRELAKIGFADIRQAVAWGSRPEPKEDAEDDDDLRIYPVELISSEEIDDDIAAAVSEVSLTAQGVKIKMYDKKAALDSIGRHLGMFKDNVSIDASDKFVTFLEGVAQHAGRIGTDSD